MNHLQFGLVIIYKKKIQSAGVTPEIIIIIIAKEGHTIHFIDYCQMNDYT